MSKYTTELRYLIESGFDIGLKNYPIYKEEHREELNQKIIDHFYFREIGLETPALFKVFLNRKMNEIMPYYNQRYKSCDVEFNPLWNVELHETYTHDIDNTGSVKNNNSSNIKNNTESNQEGTTKNDQSGTDNKTNNGTNNTTQNSENVNAYSDTPQTAISTDDIKSNIFATKTEHLLNDNTNNQTTTNTESGTTTNTESGSTTNKITNTENTDTTANSQTDSTGSTKESYTKLTEGSSAGLPFSKAIEQWREIMINIDMEIIAQLEELFIQLW